MLPTNAPPDYDWYHPRIMFAQVPRSSLDILGPFEDIMRPIAEQAAKLSGRIIPHDDAMAIMPIHELQVANVLSRFIDVEVLHPDISVEALAQSSIRYG